MKKWRFKVVNPKAPCRECRKFAEGRGDFCRCLKYRIWFALVEKRGIRMREAALKWLYGQLWRKRVALGRAEDKTNASPLEIESLAGSIETIEWIIEKVLEGAEADAGGEGTV